jgi:hypothetical protein
MHGTMTCATMHRQSPIRAAVMDRRKEQLLIQHIARRKSGPPSTYLPKSHPPQPLLYTLVSLSPSLSNPAFQPPSTPFSSHQHLPARPRCISSMFKSRTATPVPPSPPPSVPELLTPPPAFNNLRLPKSLPDQDANLEALGRHFDGAQLELPVKEGEAGVKRALSEREKMFLVRPCCLRGLRGVVSLPSWQSGG